HDIARRMARRDGCKRVGHGMGKQMGEEYFIRLRSPVNIRLRSIIESRPIDCYGREALRKPPLEGLHLT
ncbi:MAG TPA: hypothetical protein VKB96_14590, partial [Gammaproteobacteria bacterium]|nr:hypothetical protein [Gammaproteobacteria bacterium]